MIQMDLIVFAVFFNDFISIIAYTIAITARQNN